MLPAAVLEPALVQLVAARTELQLGIKSTAKHEFGLLDDCLCVGHELPAKFHQASSSWCVERLCTFGVKPVQIQELRAANGLKKQSLGQLIDARHRSEDISLSSRDNERWPGTEGRARVTHR